MYDSRLIGTWKSDAPRTFREINARRDIRGAKKKKLMSLFGKLVLRFTRTHCYSQYGDHESVARYTVVAKNDWSVVTVGEDPIAGKRIFHIRFEGDDHYWICLGRIREYFKRLTKRSGKRVNR